MRQRVLFVLCVMTALTGAAIAQGKVVTNADLEKYKEKRVEAEKDLKAYYAKIGLSEEDLAKREAAEARSREELSARLRANRLERERLEIEAREREQSSMQFNVVVPQTDLGYSDYFLYGNRFYPNARVWNRPFSGPRWRATPGGIVYEPGSRSSTIWSPRLQQRSFPAWRPARRPR